MAATETLTFGVYLTELRIARRISLRTFCLSNGFDSCETSKIERDVLPPPDDETVRRYADVLGLAPESQEFRTLMELAVAGRKQFQPRIPTEEEFAPHLPVAFRTEQGGKVPREQLKDLMNLLREA